MGWYPVLVVGEDPYEELEPFLKARTSLQDGRSFVRAIPGKVVLKRSAIGIIRYLPPTRRTTVLEEWWKTGGPLPAVLERLFDRDPKTGDYGIWSDTSEIGGIYTNFNSRPHLIEIGATGIARSGQPVNQIRRRRIDFRLTDFSAILAVVWHGLWHDTDKFPHTEADHCLVVPGFSAEDLIRMVPGSEIVSEMQMH